MDWIFKMNVEIMETIIILNFGYYIVRQNSNFAIIYINKIVK